MSDIKKGDELTIGAFPQSANGEEKEPLVWTVLDIKEDGKALVITKKAIDCRQYYSSNTSMTWENCEVRSWLNGEFYDNAFTDEEKAKIAETELENPGSTVHGAKGCENTVDRIFCLSVDEAEALFESDDERKCEATDYAAARGAFLHESNNMCWWWLRTPGYYPSDAAGVNYLGYVHKSGDNITSMNNCVRAAMVTEL